MHWPKLLFLSGFLSTMLLSNFHIILSLLLMQQQVPPPTIVVKCDSSVYDVDSVPLCVKIGTQKLLAMYAKTTMAN